MRARTRLKLKVEALRRARPPRCPPGWSTAPPDFVGVGVVKAGTTWWHTLLSQHPSIEVPPVKELHFLATPDGPRPDEAEQYARWFPRPPGAIAGEWTPDYLYRAASLPRLRTAAPEAQLLVLLRDPVERYRTEVTVFDDVPDWSPQMGFDRGRYGEQLLYLFELFDPARVLVLQYELLVAEPAAELERTFRFLGVDPTFRPPDLTRPVNKTKRAKVDLPPDEVASLRARYRADAELLHRLCPHLELDRWQL